MTREAGFIEVVLGLDGVRIEKRVLEWSEPKNIKNI